MAVDASSAVPVEGGVTDYMVCDYLTSNFAWFCLTENEGNASACNTPVEEAVLIGHNQVERETAEAHGAEYVDIIPWFCTQETCPAVIGGLTVHRDALHINENYAIFLSSALAEATGLAPT